MHDENQKALETLQQTILQFPYSTDAHLKLVRYYFTVGEWAAAKLKASECKKMFSQNLRVQRQINQLIKLGPFIRLFNLPANVELACETAAVNLPAQIQNLFRSFKEIPGEHFLVGGAVINLLRHDAAIKDLDFVSTCEEDKVLLSKNFQKNRYISNLYNNYDSDYPIDFYISKNKSEEGNRWIKKDAIRRDFTITSLLCDGEGNIIDPLGLGLSDLKQNRLRIIGDPSIRLKEDPILLLRTAYFQTRGFEPDEPLKQAMQAWEAPDLYAREHVISVIQQHLAQVNDKEIYLQHLLKYNLLKKIFSFNVDPSQKNIPQLFTEYLIKCNYRPVEQHNNYSRLFTPPIPVGQTLATSPVSRFSTLPQGMVYLMQATTNFLWSQVQIKPTPCSPPEVAVSQNKTDKNKDFNRPTIM